MGMDGIILDFQERSGRGHDARANGNARYPGPTEIMSGGLCSLFEKELASPALFCLPSAAQKKLIHSLE